MLELCRKDYKFCEEMLALHYAVLRIHKGKSPLLECILLERIDEMEKILWEVEYAEAVKRGEGVLVYPDPGNGDSPEQPGE